MKVVLNKCAGSFGVSHAAMMKIFELKGIIVFPYARVWNDNEDEKTYVFTRIKNDHKPSSYMKCIHYFQLDPVVENFTVGYEEYYTGEINKRYLRFNSDTIERTDFDLITAVEILGSEANGESSELEIIEIPDNFEYIIHEEMGDETIYFGLQLGTA